MIPGTYLFNSNKTEFRNDHKTPRNTDFNNLQNILRLKIKQQRPFCWKSIECSTTRHYDIAIKLRLDFKKMNN